MGIFYKIDNSVVNTLLLCKEFTARKLPVVDVVADSNEQAVWLAYFVLVCCAASGGLWLPLWSVGLAIKPSVRWS